MNYPKVAAAVYQMCAAFDAYMPELNPDIAKAWGTVFERYALDPADLFAAVQRIYAERITTGRGERYRVAPADIAQTAREIRKDRTERESAEDQAARLEERDRRIQGITYEAEALAIEPSERRYDDPSGAGPKFTRCPICNAIPGQPCRNTTDNTVKTDFHPARVALAAANADAKRAPLRQADPLDLDCPKCKSAAGEKCVSGGLPMWDVHSGRRP
jgi:hypothetical protein